MIKRFRISQKVKVNGQHKYEGASIHMDEADIEGFVTALKLEGEVTVTEEKSKSGNGDLEVGVHNVLRSITMTSEKGNKAYMFASKGGFITSDTLQANDVKAAVININPFEYEPTLKPIAEKVKSDIQA